MSSIFRLDASIRTEGSVTRSIADRLQSTLDAALHPTMVRRDVGVGPIPSTAWAGAVFGPHVPEGQRTPQQEEGLALSRQIADELAQADAYIYAIPLYTFGVSQHFKAWLDLLLTDPRFAPGKESAIKGRPAQLIVAKGGGYGEGTPRHGWDHATSWYRRMLEDVLSLDVEVIECELTLADVTPAMAGLRDKAAQNLADALAAAETAAQRLADRLSISAAA